MKGVIPTNNDRLRTTWTPSMDRYFIDLVLDQVRRGNMNDQSFRKQVWIHMTSLFNAKFRFQYDKDILKNRYKSLRRKYNEITSILEQSGFCWDESQQMVIADDGVWDNYIKAHPDKRSYRTKVLPYYSDLCMIYGNAPGDGNHSEELDDDSSLRTKSGEGSVFNWNPVDDSPDSSHSNDQNTLPRSKEELTDLDSSLAVMKASNDNLIPIEIIFSLDVVPGVASTIGSNCSRVSWTPSMDRYFIDLMLRNKIGRSFTKEAWMDMTSLFGEKLGPQYDKDALCNRFKTLRKQYITIKSLLGQIGFRWDKILQMVTADFYVWDDYIKAHPDARQYRTRAVLHFNALCTIYGDLTANFEDGFEAEGESSPSSGDAHVPYQPNKNLFMEPSISEPFRKSQKRPNAMVDALHDMASAVTSLTDENKQNGESISIENVIDALQAVPEIDEDLLLDACDFLEDETKAKMFLALDVRLRKKWLIRKLRPS